MDIYELCKEGDEYLDLLLVMDPLYNHPLGLAHGQKGKIVWRFLKNLERGDPRTCFKMKSEMRIRYLSET